MQAPRPLRLVLVVLLASGAAGAAPHPQAPVKTEKDERSAAALNEAARSRFTEAVKLYGKKKYDKALAAFIQAYALTGNPAVLVNLGLTSLKLGEPLRAARYLSQYLNLKETSEASADARKRAESGLAEARKSLGTLDIVAPERADITIDGESAGLAPLPGPVDVLPGRHTITIATASGAKTEQVEAPAGVVTKVNPAGAAAATPPPNAASQPTAHDAAETPAHHEAPRPPSVMGTLSPPSTLGPVYVAGVVGIASLTTAIVLGSLGANAARNRSVATEALARNGKDESACKGEVDAALASTCASLSAADRASAAVNTPFLASVSLGAGALAFAFAWYFFAPKDGAPLHPHVTADVNARGEPHASLDFLF
jgi:hypothetical protein